MTTKELLEEVNNAITAVAAGGQSYKIGSRSLTRANLTELMNVKKELEGRVAAENDSNLLGNTCVAFFDVR